MPVVVTQDTDLGESERKMHPRWKKKPKSNVLYSSTVGVTPITIAGGEKRVVIFRLFWGVCYKKKLLGQNCSPVLGDKPLECSLVLSPTTGMQFWKGLGPFLSDTWYLFCPEVLKIGNDRTYVSRYGGVLPQLVSFFRKQQIPGKLHFTFLGGGKMSGQIGEKIERLREKKYGLYEKKKKNALR